VSLTRLIETMHNVCRSQSLNSNTQLIHLINVNFYSLTYLTKKVCLLLVTSNKIKKTKKRKIQLFKKEKQTLFFGGIKV